MVRRRFIEIEMRWMDGGNVKLEVGEAENMVERRWRNRRGEKTSGQKYAVYKIKKEKLSKGVKLNDL